ncbi:extracellular solute-binding protein [[Clostridium] cellulosi]
MKKTKTTLAALLSLALIGSTFAGCSNSASNKENSSGASGGTVKLELFSTKAENLDILKTLVSTYEKNNPNVKITITAPGSSAGTALKTRLTKNDLPDIIAMGGDATYTEVESAGVLEDLSNEPFAANIQDAYKQMVYDVQENREETLYGVPYATNASGILYNEDIFNKYNISVPKTWDELISVCKTLQSKGVQPFMFTFKDAWTSLCPWNSMAPDLSPENFLTERLEGKTTFAATHKEIAQKYLELLKYGQKDMLGTTYTDGNKLFAEGKAAMMINGNWTIPEFKKTNPNFNVNLFALPASNDTSKNYVTSGVDVLFAISKSASNIDAAKKFLEYMMEPDTAQKYIDNQFAFSAIKGVTQNDKSVAGVKEDIANGKVANFPDHYYPSGFDLASITQNFAKNAQAGMDETKNINDFLAKCDKEYDAAK